MTIELSWQTALAIIGPLCGIMGWVVSATNRGKRLLATITAMSERGARLEVRMDECLVVLEQTTAKLKEHSDAYALIEPVSGEILAKVRDMSVKQTKLYDWHDHVDAHGVPVWHVRDSLEQSIGALARQIAKHAETDAEHVKLLRVLISKIG